MVDFAPDVNQGRVTNGLSRVVAVENAPLEPKEQQQKQECKAETVRPAPASTLLGIGVVKQFEKRVLLQLGCALKH
jgi:hypothetical protein